MSSTPFDPFARPAFYPDPAGQAAAQALADEAVRVAAGEFDTRLDWTVDSVRRVEEVLGRLHDRRFRGELGPEAAARHARLFGCYLGEVVRRAHGGAWGVGRLYSETFPALRIGSGRGAVDFFPTMRASARITYGPGANVWEEYQALLRKIGARRKPPKRSRRIVLRPREFYRLRHDNGYFDAGTVPGGGQVLMAFFWDGLTALFFDAGGNFVEYQVRPLPAEPEVHPVSGLPLQTPDFDAAVKQGLDAWKVEIGFHAGPIRVRRFEVPELGLGIEDRPWHFEEFLKSPEAEEPDEGEREQMWESIRQWEEEGSFVLYWGNDLW
jgi:hypothetical protein